MPYLLELVVDHHSVWVVGHTQLLCEVILFSLLGHQEGYGFLDVFESQSLEFRVGVAWLTAVKKDNNAGIFCSLAESLIGLFVEHSDVSLGSLLG